MGTIRAKGGRLGGKSLMSLKLREEDIRKT